MNVREPAVSTLKLVPLEWSDHTETEVRAECPFCHDRESFTNVADQVHWHKCRGEKETIAFINGYALVGVAAYKRANVPKGRG